MKTPKLEFTSEYLEKKIPVTDEILFGKTHF